MTSISAAPSVFLRTESWSLVAVVVTASSLFIFLTGTLSALGWVALPGLPCGRQGLLAPMRIMRGAFQATGGALEMMVSGYIQKQKSGVFLMDRFSQYLALMTLPTFWVSPYLKCSPAKKWSTRKKQFRLPANWRLEGLLLPLKGLLNLDKEDRLRLFENRICRGDWIATYTTTSTHNTATTNIAVTTTTIFESTLKSLESQDVLSPGRERGSVAICEEWIQPESVWQNKKSPWLNFFLQ